MELSNLYILFTLGTLAVLALFVSFGLLAQLNIFRKKINSDILPARPADLSSVFSPISVENLREDRVHEFNIPDVTLKHTEDYFRKEVLPVNDGSDKKLVSNKKRYTIVTVL